MAFAPTSEILTRTFRISVLDSTREELISGASVIVDDEGRQYLVTCRHIFEGHDIENERVNLGLSASLEHMFESPQEDRGAQAVATKYSFVGFGTQGSDIAVLALPGPVRDLQRIRLPEEEGATGLILGGDIGILGFPAVIPMHPEAMRLHTGGFVPAVQRGCVSYFGFDDAPKKIYLGVMNALGFSGGPVFSSTDGRNTTLHGIVEGFRTRRNPVMKNYKETSAYVLENTGIMTATTISHALDTIRANPIGPTLS